MPTLVIVGTSRHRRPIRRPLMRVSPSAVLVRVDVAYDEMELMDENPGMEKHFSNHQIGEALFKTRTVERLIKDSRAERIALTTRRSEP